jgi:hypothetical protein
MKFIKKFEDRYERKSKYKYLGEEDSKELKIFITNFIKNIDIDGNINKLTYSDFYDADFDYKSIFEDMLTSKKYDSNNIFYQIDTQFKSKGTSITAPQIRNSAFNIIDSKMKALNLDNKMEKKLIKLLEKEPTKYKNRLISMGDLVTDTVKDACRWMLDYRKYNI